MAIWIATGTLPSHGSSFGLVPAHGRRELPHPQPYVSWCTPGSREEAAKGCLLGAQHPSALTPQVVKRVLERTSSGGFCANDTIMHMTIPSLPFGGIGMPIPRNWVLREPPQPTEPSTGRVLPAPGGILPRTLPALPSPTAPYPQQVPAALGLVLNPYPVPPGTPQGRAWYRCRPSHPQRLCWGSELGVEPLPR